MFRWHRQRQQLPHTLCRLICWLFQFDNRQRRRRRLPKKLALVRHRYHRHRQQQDTLP